MIRNEGAVPDSRSETDVGAVFISPTGMDAPGNMSIILLDCKG